MRRVLLCVAAVLCVAVAAAADARSRAETEVGVALPTGVKCKKTYRYDAVSGKVCEDGATCSSSNYANNMDTCIFIEPKALDDDHYVTFHAQFVEMEDGYDYVQIYDTDGGFTRIEEFLEPGAPAYESNKGFLIYTHTDDSNGFRGWQGEWAIHGNDGEPTIEEEVTFNWNMDANKRKCGTTNYQNRFVVRQGCAFDVSIYPPQLQVTGFKIEPQGSRQRGHTVQVGQGSDFAKVTAGSGGKFSIEMGPEAAVGEYKLTAVTSGGEVSDGTKSFTLIFNPFIASSPVYLDKQSWVDEYLHNDAGLAFRGSAPSDQTKVPNQLGASSWTYDQYDPAVLQTIFNLISNLDLRSRLDPKLLMRYLTYQINDKLLWGRWDGKYDDGRRPGYWTGSGAIYRQFLSTGQQVKYGQCWVFAGVLTTAARALGVPARPVTNYNSAHEHKPFDQIVDEYWIADGSGKMTRDGDASEDSVWNFHVWVEAWMSRTDIGAQNGGWQAIDATAQEESDGLYQTGPASLNSMKAGQTTQKYDNAFVMGETNGEMRRWIKNPGETKYKLYHIAHHHVGSFASTKKRSDERSSKNYVDIKCGYKQCSNGMETGRAITWPNNFFLQLDENEPKFTIAEVSDTTLGEPLRSTLQVEYAGAEARSITVNCEIIPRGTDGKKEWPAVEEPKVQGKALSGAGSVVCEAPFAKYQDVLGETVDFKVVWSASATGKKGGAQSLFLDEALLSVTVPGPKITPEQVTTTVGAKATVEVEYTNPLSRPLTECTAIGQVSSAGYDERNEKKLPAIPAGKSEKVTFTIKTPKEGDHTFSVAISCKELDDISADIPVKVGEGVNAKGKKVSKPTFRDRGLTALAEKFEALNTQLKKIGEWIGKTVDKVVGWTKSAFNGIRSFWEKKTNPENKPVKRNFKITRRGRRPKPPTQDAQQLTP